MLNYLRIIRKWWVVIVLLLVTTVGTMLIISFFTKPEYEATVTMQVSAPPPQEAPLYSDFGRTVAHEEIIQTQTRFGELLQEGDSPWVALKTLPDVKMEGDELRERITIDVPENTQLMRVKVRAPEAEMAALLANTLVEVGLKQFGELLAQPTANTRKFIEQELGLSREELKNAEAELTQFQIKNKIVQLQDAIDNQYQLLRALQLQRDLAQAGGDVTQAQALDEIILEREAELQNVLGLATEYNDLNNRVGLARSNYDFLLQRTAEAQIKENQILEVGYIQVITPARPPRQPAEAINNKLIVLGAVVSILAGILLAFLLEYMHLPGSHQDSQQRPYPSDVVVLSDKVS